MILPGGVLIADDTAAYAAEVMRRGLKDLRRDGIELPAPMLELLNDLERSAVRDRVVRSVVAPTGETTTKPMMQDMEQLEVGTAAAARALGLGSRQAVKRRIEAGTLPARKVDGKWRIRAEYLGESA